MRYKFNQYKDCIIYHAHKMNIQGFKSCNTTIHINNFHGNTQFSGALIWLRNRGDQNNCIISILKMYSNGNK